MLFELANAPSYFQNFVNDVLGNKILDLLVMVYVNDTLVFSKALHEYQKYIKNVLARLQAAGF